MVVNFRLPSKFPLLTMETLSHSMSADPSQHHEELIERIDALRTKQRLCDVTVVVKGEEFQAHKLVLAASSPFFLSLLESQMKERTEDVIKIELQEATAPSTCICLHGKCLIDHRKWSRFDRNRRLSSFTRVESNGGEFPETAPDNREQCFQLLLC